MADWTNIKEAESVSTKRKANNFGVRQHRKNRIANLVEIQQNVLNHRLRTDEYRHERRKSGQDKWRDISKLHFHPNHIQHQLLTMVAEPRINKALISHTYASRKGYGQLRAAQYIYQYTRRNKDDCVWYAQGDVRKYYEHIRHSLLRYELNRLFKDKEFVDCFLEPFERYSPSGVGIPLGINPSRDAGNIGLMGMDRLALETLHCKGYVRYLDDFVFFGKTKGEVKGKMERLEKWANEHGYELHVPKIHRLREGLDTMGFIYYGRKKDMYWRKSNKRRWLRRRARVSNQRRIRELDDAAWGMLKWGNKECKFLFRSVTGRKMNKNKKKGKKSMPVSFGNCGIQVEERKDANGVKFIEAQRISMQMVLGKEISIIDCARNIKTSQGDGRYALKIRFMGGEYKLIVNAIDIKGFVDSLVKYKVTEVSTVFIDTGRNHYSVDYSKTKIVRVDGKEIEEREGKVVFKGTDTPAFV